MSQTFGNSMPDSTTADVRQRSVRMSSRMRPIAPSTTDADAQVEAIPVPVVSFPRISRETDGHRSTESVSTKAGSVASVPPDAPSQPTSSNISSTVMRQEVHRDPSAEATKGVIHRPPIASAVPASVASIKPSTTSVTSSRAPAVSPEVTSSSIASHPQGFDPLSEIVTAARKAAKRTTTPDGENDYGLPDDHNDYAMNLKTSELNPTFSPMSEPADGPEGQPSVVDLADAVWLKRQKLIYEVLFQITLTAILITILLIVHAWLTGKLFAPPPVAPPPINSPTQVDGRLHDPLTSSSSPAPASRPIEVRPTEVRPTEARPAKARPATDSRGAVDQGFPVQQTNHERVENSGLRIPDLSH